MRPNPLRAAITRACTDAAFRGRLLADAKAALAEEGMTVPDGVEVVVHEPQDDALLIVLPAQNEAQLQAHETMPPAGPVSGVPAGLTLSWCERELTAAGRIDSATASALRQALTRYFGDVWLNLADVTYLSSAGIAALLAAHKHLADHQSTLFLVNLTDPVRNVLDLVGLSDAFDILEPVSPYIVPATFGYPIV